MQRFMYKRKTHDPIIQGQETLLTPPEGPNLNRRRKFISSHLSLHHFRNQVSHPQEGQCVIHSQSSTNAAAQVTANCTPASFSPRRAATPATVPSSAPTAKKSNWRTAARTIAASRQDACKKSENKEKTNERNGTREGKNE